VNIFLVFLTFALWSTSFTFGKIALQVSSPLFVTGVRMMIAGIALLIYLKVRGKSLKIYRQQWFYLSLLALFAVYLSNLFEFWGLQYLTAAKACFIYSLSPFLSAIFSYFQFKEKLTPKKCLGLFIGLVGFFPVLMAQSDFDSLVGGIAYLSWPELALIAATVFSVYGWIVLRKLGKDCQMSTPLANGYAMLFGGLLAFTQSGLSESWSPSPVTNWWPFVEGVFFLLIISNVICYNLYGHLLKKFTATILSMAGLTTPIFAAFFGWLFLGETVGWTFFLSIGVISSGLWLVHSEELRLGYVQKGN
jgi:drug/metabolite transporter (DMT)-like permease